MRVALLITVGAAAHAAEPNGPDLGMVGTSLLDIVAHGVTTLSVMSAGGDDYDVLLAAWSDDAASPRAVYLALHAPRRLRAHDHADGRLELRHSRGLPAMVSDRRSQLPCGRLRHRPKSVPTVLGTLDGALIQAEQVEGATVIEVYQDAELQKSPICWGWDNDRLGLKEVPCKAAQS